MKTTTTIIVGRALMKMFALGVAAAMALGVAPPSARAETRLEQALAAAAGRAAARVASHFASNAVLVGAERAKAPACQSGANQLMLHGFRRAIFIAECRKIL